jgi:hypothetical protein
VPDEVWLRAASVCDGAVAASVGGRAVAASIGGGGVAGVCSRVSTADPGGVVERYVKIPN